MKKGVMERRREITRLIERLVRFKTTSDNINEINECSNFIIEYFNNNKNKNLIIKKYIIENKPAIVITLRKTKNPELFLVGHFDVVPGEKEQFIPKIKNARIYGRGVYDNKSTVAILMLLIKEYSMQKIKPDFGIILTSDEETCGDNAEQLIKKYSYRCNFALVLDGGSNSEIIIKEKGLIWLKITALGRAAHGAHPWKGRNAIEKLMHAYFKIKKLFPKTTINNRWKTTLNIGKMFGGDAFNKVPDYAEMWLDIRYTEATNTKELISKIKKIKGIKISVNQFSHLLINDKNNRYIQKLKKSVKKITKKAVIGFEHGCSDARFFSEKKIPTALISAEGHNIHSKNEYVEVKSVERLYEIIKDFINTNIRKSISSPP